MQVGNLMYLRFGSQSRSQHKHTCTYQDIETINSPCNTIRNDFRLFVTTVSDFQRIGTVIDNYGHRRLCRT